MKHPFEEKIFNSLSTIGTEMKDYAKYLICLASGSDILKSICPSLKKGRNSDRTQKITRPSQTQQGN
jgi:hypothetical protein